MCVHDVKLFSEFFEQMKKLAYSWFEKRNVKARFDFNTIIKFCLSIKND